MRGRQKKTSEAVSMRGRQKEPMEKKALEDMQERGQQMSMRGRQRETASEAADAAEERAWEEQQANDWEDWLEDDCDVPCIFTPGLTFPRAEAALAHDREHNGFDLVATRAALGLDFYGTIRMVNFLRAAVARAAVPAAEKGQRPSLPAAEAARIVADLSAKTWVADDAFLKPTLPDDPLLRELGELGADDEDWSDDSDDDVHGGAGAGAGAGAGEDESKTSQPSAPPPAAAAAGASSDGGELAQLRAENDALRARLSEAGAAHASAAKLVKSLFEEDEKVVVPDPAFESVDNDTYYFSSYSNLSIHREMIEDRVRTDSYRRAIEGNAAALFKGKVVLDVGCGTGILSLFACRAGAKKVVGVDMSAMAPVAQANANANGYGGVMTVVRGKVEDVELPLAKGEADVIISEWMGYALLYECMLETVLVARERWLKPGGVVLPDVTTVVIEGLEAPLTPAGRGTLDFWDDVYGFNFSAVKAKVPARQLGHSEETDVKVLDPEHIVTGRCEVQALKMCTMTIPEVDFVAPFALTLRDGAEGADDGGGGGGARRISSLIVSFDTHFSAEAGCVETPVTFKTDAASTPTHWKQTVLKLPQEVLLARGLTLRGRLSIKRAPVNPREILIDVLDLFVEGGTAEQAKRVSVHWHMK